MWISFRESHELDYISEVAIQDFNVEMDRLQSDQFVLIFRDARDEKQASISITKSSDHSGNNPES